MDELLTNPERRQCCAAIGGSLLGVQQWSARLLADVVPPLREALDIPRCLSENEGWSAPRRARYQPDAGGTTGAVRCTPDAKPRLIGSPLADSLVVVSGLGGVVQRIAKDGGESWRTRLTQPRGAFINGEQVGVGSGRTIWWLNKRSGAKVGATQFDWPVNGFWLRDGYLAVAFRVQGAGAVRVYALRGFEAHEICRVHTELGYPRGVYLSAEALYVADTFGHRVLRFAGRSGNFSSAPSSAASFYPNSVRLSAGRLLVTEEHINQVVAMDPETLSRRPAVAACWPGDGGVVALNALIAKVNVRAADRDSVCFARGPMARTLMAPNDAAQSGEVLYVADTDNHRIVMFRGGVLTSVLSNFNEPVNVDIVA
jgi:hypothetical protein